MGRCIAHIGQHRVEPSSELVFAAALLLGIDRGRSWRRAEFGEILWPRISEPVRATRLRWLLAKLRRLGLPLVAGRDELLVSTENVVLDTDSVGDSPLTGIGPILSNYSPGFSHAFDDWLEARRATLTSRALAPLTARLSAALSRFDDGAVLDIGCAILALDPANENAALAVAQTQSRMGEVGHALAGLERFISESPHAGGDSRVAAGLLLDRCRRAIAAGRSSTEAAIVGRDAELAHLDAHVSSAIAGRGGGIVLVGAPGMGKTTILHEVARRASLRGMHIARVRCQRADVSRPLSGIVDAVVHLLEIPGAAGCHPINLAALRRLSQTTTSQRTDQTDIDSRQRRTKPTTEAPPADLVHALIDLLDAISSESPLFVAIDDAQWMTPDAASILDKIMTWSASSAVIWLFAIRTGHDARVPQHLPRISLEPLAPESSEQLLDDFTRNRGTEIEDQTRKTIVAHGAGTPLFLLEIAKQWLRSGQIEGVPSSLVPLIDTALGHLSADALRVLQSSAVLGTYATLERVESLVQLPRPAFYEALWLLEQFGILTSDASGVLHGHLLWGESALARGSRSARRVMHRHAAVRFEQELAEEHRHLLLWQAAHHWELAGCARKARRALVEGAASLALAGFPLESARAYGRAAEVTPSHSDRLPLLRDRIRLLVRGGEIALARQEIAAYQLVAQQAEPGYDRHNELELLDGTLRHSESKDFLTFLTKTLDCARDPAATTGHRIAAAKECSRGGHYEDPAIIAAAWEAIRDLAPSTYEERRDYSIARWEFERACGDIRACLALTEDRLAWAQQAGDAQRVLNELGHKAEDLMTLGQIGDARALYEQLLQRVRAIADPRLELWIHDRLMWLSFEFEGAELNRRRVEQARPIFADMQRRGYAVGTEQFLRVYEIELAIAEGRGDDALLALGPITDTLQLSPAVLRHAFLACHLAAQRLTGAHRETGMIVERLMLAFTYPSRYLDRPAKQLSMHLVESGGRAAAAAFARHYVRHIRRQLYAPPSIVLQLAQEQAPADSEFSVPVLLLTSECELP